MTAGLTLPPRVGTVSVIVDGWGRGTSESRTRVDEQLKTLGAIPRRGRGSYRLSPPPDLDLGPSTSARKDPLLGVPPTSTGQD